MEELRSKLIEALQGWLHDTAGFSDAPEKALVLTLDREEVVQLKTLLEVYTHSQADIDMMWSLVEGCREANRRLRLKLGGKE
jgi:hypothetical protein